MKLTCNIIVSQTIGMSTKYKVIMSDMGYFITITTVGWKDFFTRVKQKYILINSLRYCQKEKGLEVYAYCVMHCQSPIYLQISASKIRNSYFYTA